MTTKQPESPDHAHPEIPDTHDLLRRILASVEKDGRRGRLELALAIILSLATLSSTWCGFQANRWGGTQSGSQAAADTAERQAAEDTIVGLQLRTFDGITMVEYWKALRQGEAEVRDAIFARMRPQLQRAIEAAIAAGVLHDPKAMGPLQRPEYVLPEEQNSKRLREEARQFHTAAREAGQACGSYVLMTLAFASVLFFGGITGTFTSRRVRTGLGGVALVLFLVAVVILIGLPVSKG